MNTADPASNDPVITHINVDFFAGMRLATCRLVNKMMYDPKLNRIRPGKSRNEVSENVL
jgi:hypothetical protein